MGGSGEGRGERGRESAAFLETEAQGGSHTGVLEHTQVRHTSNPDTQRCSVNTHTRSPRTRPTDAEHIRTHHMLTYRTQTTHIGSHAHYIYT